MKSESSESISVKGRSLISKFDNFDQVATMVTGLTAPRGPYPDRATFCQGTNMESSLRSQCNAKDGRNSEESSAARNNPALVLNRTDMEIKSDFQTPRRSPLRVPNSLPDRTEPGSPFRPTVQVLRGGRVTSPGKLGGRSPAKTSTYAVVARPGLQRDYEELQKRMISMRRSRKGKKRKTLIPMIVTLTLKSWHMSPMKI